VMFSVAIVSALTIGRPIRRIAKVLMQLAGGRNAVEIPYQGRQDEVGTPPGAGVFRDNIVRHAGPRAEQKAHGCGRVARASGADRTFGQ